jgi:F-type H+-transporting ATPase subunit b
MEQLVKFDPGLMIWTWVTFFIVLSVLATKAWRPMINALEQREQRIREALSKAEKAREESEVLNEKVEAQLQESRKEAQQILADARTAAEKLRAELEAVARKKAKGLLTSAQEQINAEKERALREIRSTVVDLSVSIAGKLIERNISSDDNRRLAEESISQIGKA